MPETLSAKILRHIEEREFDSTTLKRGINQILLTLLNRNEDEGRLLPPQLSSDYLGINGLLMAAYTFYIPQLPQLSIKPDSLQTLEMRISPRVRIYEFPEGCLYDSLVTGNNVPAISTANMLNLIPGAIASFTGPTFFITDQVPNNGFYAKDFGTLVDFQDTNPPGQRRGAFAITDTGELLVLDDYFKWGLVRGAYSELRALVGTSYYFTNNDTSPESLFFASLGKMQASFLMQYRDSEGGARTCFAVSNNMISRSVMRKVVDNYVDLRGGLSYVAVEMELAGAACMVRGRAGIESFGGQGFYRRDHYLVLPPKT